MSEYTYIQGKTSGPAIALEWEDGDGQPRAFATGWTFEAELTPKRSDTVALTKTTGITGADEFPNVVVDWTAEEIAGLDPGEYRLLVTATPSAGDAIAFKPKARPIITILAD